MFYFIKDIMYPTGGPVADLTSIAFPYDTAGMLWSIQGNRSEAAEFTGTCPVVAAAWSLLLTQAPPNTFGEAAGGGSLTLHLLTGLENRMVGAAGAFRWYDTILKTNGQGIELEARQADSSARLELDLWTPARTETSFAQQSITRLFFSSRRNGPDIAMVSGGLIRNRWDLPRTAADEPFPYEGTVELLAVIAEATGRLRIIGFRPAAAPHPESPHRGTARCAIADAATGPVGARTSRAEPGGSRLQPGSCALHHKWCPDAGRCGLREAGARTARHGRQGDCNGSAAEPKCRGVVLAPIWFAGLRAPGHHSRRVECHPRCLDRDT